MGFKMKKGGPFYQKGSPNKKYGNVRDYTTDSVKFGSTEGSSVPMNKKDHGPNYMKSPVKQGDGSIKTEGEWVINTNTGDKFSTVTGETVKASRPQQVPPKAPGKMKSSGFKMKGSPFHRNFGVGSSPVEMASPMKVAGIYPVDFEGNILDNMSSTEVEKHIKDGGKVIKTGADAVASNKAAVEADIASGEIVPYTDEEYGDEGMTTQADWPGDRGRTEQRILDASPDGEGGYMQKYTDYLGEDLVNKEKAIQDFLNTNPGEELPPELKSAQSEIMTKLQNMYDATSGEKRYEVQNDMASLFDRGWGGDLSKGVTDPNYISATTGTRKLGEGEDPVEGQDRIFEVGVEEGKEQTYGPNTYPTQEFKDIEVAAGEGEFGTQASGTEQQKEEDRLAAIALQEEEAAKEALRLQEQKAKEDEKARKIEKRENKYDEITAQLDAFGDDHTSRKYKKWEKNLPDWYWEMWRSKQ